MTLLSVISSYRPRLRQMHVFMLTLLKGSSVAAAGGVEDSVLTDIFLASRSLPFCSC